MPTEAERKYEALEQRMKELKAEMIALSAEVHADRVGTTDGDAAARVGTTLAVTSKAAALDLKARAERNLDALAESMRGEGETFAKAYTRAVDTDLGRSMLATLDEATDLAAGRPTARQVEAHRKALAG